jgi:hypothetical protein
MDITADDEPHAQGIETIEDRSRFGALDWRISLL